MLKNFNLKLKELLNKKLNALTVYQKIFNEKNSQFNDEYKSVSILMHQPYQETSKYNS